MMKEFKMPKLRSAMTEGVIGLWNVSEGDTVKKGDIILEIETDKITAEIESPYDGIVSEIIAKVGDKMLVDAVLALIEEK